MVGYADVAPAHGRLGPLRSGEFRNVLGQGRNVLSLDRVSGIVREQMGVVLDRSAAARGVDDDGIKRPMLAL